MANPQTTDLLVVGGGIVGLSVAYQLAGEGLSVRLVERGEVGRQASWAGAGVLPPGSWYSRHPALEPAAALSHELHAAWSAELRDTTGVDDEHEQCGALYAVPRDASSADAERLEERLRSWSRVGIESKRIDHAALRRVEPELAGTDAFLVPAEAQVRNPRRLRALRLGCEARGVLIESHAAVRQFDCVGDRIESVHTAAGNFTAGAVCLTAGAWTGELGKRLGIHVPTRPIRGQIVLLRSASRRLQHIFHQDGKYLVPRRDGRVLVGATVEDVGFDTSTRPEDVKHLVAFAHQAAPYLVGATVEDAWAGLRPAADDELPLIGRLPGLANGWIAAGHFRSGLQFAPATAVVLSQLIRGEPTEFNATPFDPARFVAPPHVADEVA